MDKVLFDNLGRQYRKIYKEVDPAIERVLTSGRYTLGPEVKTFEDEFTKYIGAKYAIGVSSGTAALFFGLKGANYPHEMEVILPANTYIATAFAVNYTQSRPVLVDVDPDTHLMRAEEVAKAITPLTRAIIPVHLFGQTVDLDPILALANERGIPIIEDVAQAVGAKYKGKKVGSLGLAGCFSFYPSKNLGAMGDGGMITTDDEYTNLNARRLRYMGQTQKYDHEEIGYQERLDALQAAILSVKLGHLDEWNTRRKAIASRYTTALMDSPVIPPVTALGADHVYHLYVVRVAAGIRDTVRAKMLERGVETQIHYPTPLHLQKCYSYLGYKPGDFPVAERNSREMISLPIYPELTDAELDRVVDTLLEAVKGALENHHVSQ